VHAAGGRGIHLERVRATAVFVDPRNRCGAGSRPALFHGPSTLSLTLHETSTTMRGGARSVVEVSADRGAPRWPRPGFDIVTVAPRLRTCPLRREQSGGRLPDARRAGDDDDAVVSGG